MSDSFYAEKRGRGTVYHGGRGCGYGSGETFRCSTCKRTICYCGGHCGIGNRECPSNCGKCDECCRGLDGSGDTAREEGGNDG